jgi:hypothetical protein
MAIGYVTNALGGTADTTSFSVTLPTTAAGDILILEFAHRGTGDGTIAGTSVSTGGLTWALKHSRVFNTSFSGKTYWTRATGNHAGQTVTGASLTNSCAAIVTQYSGAIESGDPLADATIVGEDNASGDEGQAAITTATDGAYVALVVVNSPDLAVTSMAAANLTLSARAERLSTGGTDTSIAHASGPLATAGSSGAFTWAQTNAAGGSWAYAIKPAVATTAVRRIPLVTRLEPKRYQRGGIQVLQSLLLTTLAATVITHSGSGALTLPLPTASGTAVKTRLATGAANLPLLTASGTGVKVRSGSGSPTLPLLTASGTGVKTRAGSGTATLPLLTASGSGGSTSEGSGSATLPLLTASGTGVKTRSGSGAPTLPLLTSSGTGTKVRSGSGAASLPLLTAAGTGTKTRTGSGTPTLPLLTASGTGGAAVAPLRPVDMQNPVRRVRGAQQPTHFRPAPDATPRFIGSGAITLPLLTASGSGSGAAEGDRPFFQTEWYYPIRDGGLDPSQDWVNVIFRPAAPFAQLDWPNPVRRKAQPQLVKIGGALAAAEAPTHSGAGTPTLPLLTASGSGTKVRSGSGTVSLPVLTASGSGTKTRAGSGAATLPVLTGSGSGTKTRTGSGAVTLPLLGASGDGPGASSGSGAGTLPLLTASGTGSKVRKGSGAATLPVLTASGDGSSGFATHSGSGQLELPLLTSSGDGTKSRFGSGELTLPLLTADGASLVRSDTDLSSSHRANDLDVLLFDPADVVVVRVIWAVTQTITSVAYTIPSPMIGIEGTIDNSVVPRISYIRLSGAAHRGVHRCVAIATLADSSTVQQEFTVRGFNG